MTHPEDSTLAELAQGSLDADSRRSVEDHLSGCASCRNLLAQLLKAFVPDDAVPMVTVLRKGLVVDRYVVLEPIGAGALGEVFSAYDTTLERTVALKWLYPSVHDEDRAAQRQRLISEARALARVQHQNVVAVFDVEARGSTDVIVMELVPHAKSLRADIGSGRGWREVVARFVDAGLGLGAAHQAGVVHGDFKPDNVLVDAAGRVRVADFGLARATQPPEAGDQQRSTLSGTPAYLAPERWRGVAASALSDQYSFCLSLAECLSGRPVFVATSVPQRLELMRAGPGAMASVPALVERAIRRGLAFEPAERFESMQALVAALSKSLEQGTRRRAVVAVSALVVLALGSGALAWRQSRSRCDGAGEPVRLAWNKKRGEAVRAAFAATGHPAAASLATRVVGSLDGLAAQLVGARVAACEASARHGASDASLALRDGCLQRRVDDLVAIAGVLEAADTRAVEKSVGAIEQLPSADQCLDVAALARREPRPGDAAVHATLDSLAAQVSMVRALRLAGKGADSLARAQSIDVAVRAAGWRPLVAEHLAEWASGLERAMKLDEAHAKYLEAMQLALGANDASTATDALLGLAYVDGVDGNKVEAAQAWVALAHGVLVPGSADVQRVDNLEGLLAIKSKRFADSLVVFERVAAALEAAGRRQTIGYARVLQNENGPLRELGRPEEALAKSKASMQIMQAVLSPEHPDVAVALNNIGSAVADLQRYDEAAGYFRQCLELRTRLYGAEAPVLASVHYNLGELALRLGDGATALSEYGQSRALVEKARGADDDDAVDAHAGEGFALALLGRHDEALALLEAVMPQMEGRKFPPWNLAQARLGIAGALEAMHRDRARAVALAKQVVALEGPAHAQQRAAAMRLLASK